MRPALSWRQLTSRRRPWAWRGLHVATKRGVPLVIGTHTWPLDRCIDWLARWKRVWRHARTRLQAKVGTWQVYGQKASAVFTKGHLALSATVLHWSRSYGRWWFVSRLLFANLSPECTVLFFLILQYRHFFLSGVLKLRAITSLPTTTTTTTSTRSPHCQLPAVNNDWKLCLVCFYARGSIKGADFYGRIARSPTTVQRESLANTQYSSTLSHRFFCRRRN